MKSSTVRVLLAGASVLLLAACGSSPSLGPSGSRSTSGAAARSTAGIRGDAYPLGRYGAWRTAATLQPGAPRAGWISPDAKKAQLLYVSNAFANTVDIYMQKGKNQQPVGELTSGLNIPGGSTVDSKGNFYVANEGINDVLVFAPGATKPTMTYSTGLSSVTAVAVANDGTVYIADFNGLSNGWVEVYPQGNTGSAYRLTDFGGGAPFAVALDSSQNLYVQYDVNGSGTSAVNKYAPGATTGTNLNLAFKWGGGIQVDRGGNIVVVQQLQPSEILVFAPGQTQPSRTMTLPDSDEPFVLALNAKGSTLFASDTTGDAMDSFKYANGKFHYTIANGFQDPAGVAVSPAQY